MTISRYGKIDRVCEACGANFKVHYSKAEKGHGRFCSQPCHNRSRKSVPLAERFKRYVGEKNENGCIEWTGSKTKGYGVIRCGGGKGHIEYAHRLSYEFKFGKIPDGLNVLHRCDNPPCINPDHLFLGTQIENIEDMQKKGRKGVGEKYRNSKLTDKKVKEIIETRKKGNITYREISYIHNVSISTIERIVNSKSWKHVSR